jgi:hypothetical protein
MITGNRKSADDIFLEFFCSFCMIGSLYENNSDY